MSLSETKPVRKAKARTRLIGSQIPSHENTRASKLNAQVERSLMNDLNTYVNLIRKELDANSGQWTKLHAILIPLLTPSVFQTMRGHISSSYQLGTEYVTGRVGLQGASFLTHADIDNIKTLSEEYTNKFFGRVGLSLNATIKKEFTKEEPNSAINPNFITNAIAISASTKALAEGTRAKVRSLLASNRGISTQAILSAAINKKKKKKKEEEKKKETPIPIIIPPIIVPSPSSVPATVEEIQDPILDDEDFFNDALLDVAHGLQGFSLGTSLAAIAANSLEDNRQWVWVTAEDPCPECATLEGEVFTIDDVDIMPVPIDDTHPHCRCRILLL